MPIAGHLRRCRPFTDAAVLAIRVFGRLLLALDVIVKDAHGDAWGFEDYVSYSTADRDDYMRNYSARFVFRLNGLRQDWPGRRCRLVIIDELAAGIAFLDA